MLTYPGASLRPRVASSFFLHPHPPLLFTAAPSPISLVPKRGRADLAIDG